MNLNLHQKALFCVRCYKRSEIEIINVLGEIDRDKMYLAFGVSSLFRYCVEKLNLSEADTAKFIQVTRKSVLVPELKQAIEKGEITTAKASRIASVIEPENQSLWIQKAKDSTHRELEKEVSKVNPKPDTKEKIKVLSPKRSELKLSISTDFEIKLKRAREVFKTSLIEETLEKALDIALDQKDPLRKAEKRQANQRSKEQRNNIESANEQSKNSQFTQGNQSSDLENGSQRTCTTETRRHPLKTKINRVTIPTPIQTQVDLRDQRKCTFKNCNETRFTEIHHVKPISKGGTNELSNLTTLCSAHHRLLHGFWKYSKTQERPTF